MEDQVSKYFQEIYNTLPNRTNINTQDNIIRIMKLSVDKQMNNALIVKVIEKEVRKVVFSMNQFKAPGPDGFPPVFFQGFWDIVKYDIYHASWDFVQT